MTVDHLISDATPPLRLGDTVEYALGLLMELRVRHLPVVGEEKAVLGILSEDRLLDAGRPEDLVDGLLAGEPVTAHMNDHVFEVARLMMEHDLTTVPVIKDGRYGGLVRRHDLFEWFARSLSTHSPGAILALEIPPRDYSLSRVIHAIEQTDVRVLSVGTEQSDANDGTVRVTIKINVTEASRARAMLEREGYQVVAAFGEEEDQQDLDDRVQAFMRYLEV
ncbi:MAG: acetoin utilization protein AcuB [Rhodothermales bacterium]|jgi:acetoin utilization protein AcuB